MMKLFLSLLMAISMLFPFSISVKAEEHRLPDGVTALNLSVTETKKIEEDLIVSRLRYEAKGKESKAVQNEINEAMGKALNAIKKEKDVTVTTQSYNVRMRRHYNKDNRTEFSEEWHGTQALTMKSENIEAIQELTAQLQNDGFLTSGFQYTLSPEKSRLIKENLLKGAIEKLKQQAQNAAEALGKKRYDIREINVDGGHYFPRPFAARAMLSMNAAESVAPPQASGGDQEVSLTINARVELK